MLQCGLDLCAALGGHCLLFAAPLALQVHLALRSGQAGRGVVQHQLAGAGEVAVQSFCPQHGLEVVAAQGGQRQQLRGAAFRGGSVAGAQKLQPPAPLVGVPLQAQLERRAGRQQQPGQLPPDAGVCQGLHIAVAQLRAIATAGARAGLRLVDDGDLQAALLKFIRRGQADDACA